MLREAIRWQDGQVLAFDEKGESILELQGHYEDVKEKVLRRASLDTVFSHGVWRGECGDSALMGIRHVRPKHW